MSYEEGGLWVGQIPDIFGGYGISVASRTKEGAEHALRAEWARRMPSSSFPSEATFDEHFERFGGVIKWVAFDKPYHQGFAE
jgi:hypothetical protein